MSEAMTLWVVIVAAGGLTYLARLSFIALFARWSMPSLVTRALRYVPAAMLTAIVVPPIVLPGAGDADPSLRAAKMVAALVAAAVAWRSRSVPMTMAVGMIALWCTQWALRAAA